MSITRSTTNLRRLAASAIFLVALLLGWSLHARPAGAATSGATAFQDQAALLFQRVDQIAAKTPPGKYPMGTGLDLKLRFSEDWNSGFWAGTLWRVADLTGTPADAERASAATVDHFGYEQVKTHDQGFMYGESSVAAFERRCIYGFDASCEDFRSSGLKAANTLVRMAKTTGQGVIPLGSKTCSDCSRGGAETIVDSMMNLPLLYWAEETAGEPSYRDLALKHAKWVAKNLERSDGSTYQAASYPRKAKRPSIKRHTHQGLNDRSVWARGQAWSVYGFADAGKEFSSKAFLKVSERNANYIASHLPADGLPLWDYRAGSRAPRDVSAGVITAAGLFHLANACAAVKNGCAEAERWAPLARKVLEGSLSKIRTTSPAGYLGNQVYTLGGKATWDDNAEMVMGLDYALEAIKLAREE
jgi:unsaturated chondroitin disaccharide hydrolase